MRLDNRMRREIPDDAGVGSYDEIIACGSYEDARLAPKAEEMTIDLTAVLQRLAELETELISLRAVSAEKDARIEWLQTQLAKSFV